MIAKRRGIPGGWTAAANTARPLAWRGARRGSGRDFSRLLAEPAAQLFRFVFGNTCYLCPWIGFHGEQTPLDIAVYIEHQGVNAGLHCLAGASGSLFALGLLDFLFLLFFRLRSALGRAADQIPRDAV